MKPKHRCVRHLALCCDYDGTLAHHGQMDEPTRQALERGVASRRRLVLVTGGEPSGLAAALRDMGLSPHNAVGIGDAENDHASLKRCEVSAAAANALPSVKEGVDIVTRGDHGAGVIELADVHWPRWPARSRSQRISTRLRRGRRCAGQSSSSAPRRIEPRRARASPRRHSCTRRGSPVRGLLRG